MVTSLHWLDKSIDKYVKMRLNKESWFWWLWTGSSRQGLFGHFVHTSSTNSVRQATSGRRSLMTSYQTKENQRIHGKFKDKVQGQLTFLRHSWEKKKNLIAGRKLWIRTYRRETDLCKILANNVCVLSAKYILLLKMDQITLIDENFIAQHTDLKYKKWPCSN